MSSPRHGRTAPSPPKSSTPPRRYPSIATPSTPTPSLHTSLPLPSTPTSLSAVHPPITPTSSAKRSDRSGRVIHARLVPTSNSAGWLPSPADCEAEEISIALPASNARDRDKDRSQDRRRRGKKSGAGDHRRSRGGSRGGKHRHGSQGTSSPSPPSDISSTASVAPHTHSRAHTPTPTPPARPSPAIEPSERTSHAAHIPSSSQTNTFPTLESQIPPPTFFRNSPSLDRLSLPVNLEIGRFPTRRRFVLDLEPTAEDVFSGNRETTMHHFELDGGEDYHLASEYERPHEFMHQNSTPPDTFSQAQVMPPFLTRRHLPPSPIATDRYSTSDTTSSGSARQGYIGRLLPIPASDLPETKPFSLHPPSYTDADIPLPTPYNAAFPHPITAYTSPGCNPLSVERSGYLPILQDLIAHDPTKMMGSILAESGRNDLTAPALTLEPGNKEGCGIPEKFWLRLTTWAGVKIPLGTVIPFARSVPSSSYPRAPFAPRFSQAPSIPIDALAPSPPHHNKTLESWTTLSKYPPTPTSALLDTASPTSAAAASLQAQYQAYVQAKLAEHNQNLSRHSLRHAYSAAELHRLAAGTAPRRPSLALTLGRRRSDQELTTSGHGATAHEDLQYLEHGWEANSPSPRRRRTNFTGSSSFEIDRCIHGEDPNVCRCGFLSQPESPHAPSSARASPARPGRCVHGEDMSVCRCGFLSQPESPQAQSAAADLSVAKLGRCVHGEDINVRRCGCLSQNETTLQKPVGSLVSSSIKPPRCIHGEDHAGCQCVYQVQDDSSPPQVARQDPDRLSVATSRNLGNASTVSSHPAFSPISPRFDIPRRTSMPSSYLATVEEADDDTTPTPPVSRPHSNLPEPIGAERVRARQSIPALREICTKELTAIEDAPPVTPTDATTTSRSSSGWSPYWSSSSGSSRLSRSHTSDGSMYSAVNPDRTPSTPQREPNTDTLSTSSDRTLRAGDHVPIYEAFLPRGQARQPLTPPHPPGAQQGFFAESSPLRAVPARGMYPATQHITSTTPSSTYSTISTTSTGRHAVSIVDPAAGRANNRPEETDTTKPWTLSPPSTSLDFSTGKSIWC